MPKYRIAGLVTEYNPIYERLAAQSEKYRVEDYTPADFRLGFVDDFYDRKVAESPRMNREELEYFYLGQLFYYHLLEHDGCMIHSSSVAVDGEAFLFSAPCGTGKSTHVNQWLKLFGDKATVINDDKPAVRKIDGKYYVFGTPFSGKTDLNENIRVPLKAICILERGTENSITSIDPKEAIVFFLSQTARSRLENRMSALLDIMNDMFSEIPIYKMKCNISVDAAKMAYEAMKGDKTL